MRRTLRGNLTQRLFSARMGTSCFLYAKDPVCITAILAFYFNTLVLKTMEPAPSSFIHCYLNDCLLIPATLPIILTCFKKLGLRSTDSAPTLLEILFYLSLGGAFFELLGPALVPSWVQDPYDLLAYSSGAFFAHITWQLLYSDQFQLRHSSIKSET